MSDPGEALGQIIGTLPGIAPPLQEFGALSQAASNGVKAATSEGAGFVADFDAVQIQAKFKHAGDFGVNGNYNAQNANAFVDAMSNSIDNSVAIAGSYRGDIPVTHYFDSTTRLNVMVGNNGNFISGWRLSPDQAQNLMRTGNVQ